MLVSQLISRNIFVARYIEQFKSCVGKGLEKLSCFGGVWVVVVDGLE